MNTSPDTRPASRLTPAVIAAIAAVTAAGLILLAVWSRPASPTAPAQLVSISPANGSALTSAPTSVELTLSTGIDASLSHVTVRDSAGTSVNLGEIRRIASEQLRQPVATNTTGDFTVAYHVTLTDGRQVTGWTNFSVNTGTAPAAPAVAPIADDGAHSHGVDPVGATLLVINGLVLLGVLVMLRLRPKPVRPADR